MTEYYVRKDRGTQHSSCKECTKARATAHFQKDPEARKQYKHDYYRQNKEKVTAKIKEWGERNKDKVKAARKQRHQETKHERRVNNLKQLYGIDDTDYDRMLVEQGGCCAICGSKDHKNSRTKYFAVDHCHSTGVVRGLLCNSCNKGIGLLQDNPEVLKAAAGYLERQKT